MQCLRLSEKEVTRYHQIMSTLLKLGLSGCDVKPLLVRPNANISYKIHFFLEKILVALETHTRKMNLPSIILGGGAR